MSASAQHAVISPQQHIMPDAAWPACEDAVLPGDGSMRWLGMLLLGSTTLISLRAIYWVGDVILTHL